MYIPTVFACIYTIGSTWGNTIYILFAVWYIYRRGMSQLQWREAAKTILGAWSYVPSISEWACNYYGLLLSWTTAYITMFLPNKQFSSVNTIARCSVHVRVVHPSSCECAYAYVLNINTFGWRIILYLAYNYIHDIMLSCSWHFIVSLCMRKSPMTLLVPRPYHVFQRYTQRWKTPALHQIRTNQVCKHRSTTYRWKIWWHPHAWLDGEVGHYFGSFV